MPGEDELKHQCYVCGIYLSQTSKHLSDELTSCNVSFEDKLCQIISQERPNDRTTDLVCVSCWSLIENISRQQNELLTMIEEVNERLTRSCQQNLEVKTSFNTQENKPEVGLHFDLVFMYYNMLLVLISCLQKMLFIFIIMTCFKTNYQNFNFVSFFALLLW